MLLVSDEPRCCDEGSAMALLRLDADRIEVLHLFTSQPNNVAFYEFERSPYLEYWDIVSIEQRRADPLLLDVRLLHIDELMLDEDQDNLDDQTGQESDGQEPGADDEALRFDAFNWAQGFMSPTPAEFNDLIQLLETWLEKPLPRADDPITRFRRVARDELTHWRVKAANPKQEAIWYQYLPDAAVASADEITLIHPARWRANSRYGLEQHGFFEIVTFQRQRLADPGFKPLDTWGAGRIVLNHSALREFVSLLMQHSFEHMVGGSEP
jgi:hypothetical protein